MPTAIRGCRSRVILTDIPEVKVLIKPGTRTSDVKRILQKIISSIDQYGMPKDYVCYGELYFPPHVERRLRTREL